MILCVVVVAGFSRLTALATILLVSFVPITVIALIAINSPADATPHLFRMSIQLILVAICCYFLRRSIEAREWDLYLLAKENLRRNKYAQELELAKVAAEELTKPRQDFWPT